MFLSFADFFFFFFFCYNQLFRRILSGIHQSVKQFKFMSGQTAPNCSQKLPICIFINLHFRIKGTIDIIKACYHDDIITKVYVF